MAKGCPGCGPVPWGSFLSGYMVPQWVPLSLPPLKNNYLCGSPCQFFFKIRVAGNAQGNCLKNVLVLYVRIFQIM